MKGSTVQITKHSIFIRLAEPADEVFQTAMDTTEKTHRDSKVNNINQQLEEICEEDVFVTAECGNNLEDIEKEPLVKQEISTPSTSTRIVTKSSYISDLRSNTLLAPIRKFAEKNGSCKTMVVKRSIDNL